MIKIRNFKNEFSGELNECNENKDDGVYYTIRRFEQFIITIDDKIEQDNREIMEIIKNTDEDFAVSYLSQLDISNSLHYFKDTILKSLIVSVFSYFEFKMNQFSQITEKHVPVKQKIDSFKKIENKYVSDIEKYNAFIISEIIPELKCFYSEFEQIKIWKNIRKPIVHHNSVVNRIKIDFSKFTSFQVYLEKLEIQNNKDILDFLCLIEYYLNTIIELINKKYDLIEYNTVN